MDRRWVCGHDWTHVVDLLTTMVAGVESATENG